MVHVAHRTSSHNELGSARHTPHLHQREMVRSIGLLQREKHETTIATASDGCNFLHKQRMRAVDVAWDGRNDVQMCHSEAGGCRSCEVSCNVTDETAAEVQRDDAPKLFDDGRSNARRVNGDKEGRKASGGDALLQLRRIMGCNEEDELVRVCRMALTLQASDVAGLGDRGSVERVHCRDGSGDGSSGDVYVRYQELGIISCLHYNGWGLHSMQNEQ